MQTWVGTGRQHSDGVLGGRLHTDRYSFHFTADAAELFAPNSSAAISIPMLASDAWPFDVSDAVSLEFR